MDLWLDADLVVLLSYPRLNFRLCVFNPGDGDIAARTIPGTFSVRVNNIESGGVGTGSYYSWTRAVTVTLDDIRVRVDLLQRRRVRINRSLTSEL